MNSAIAFFPYFFDEESTPCDIFPSIMNPIHGNMRHIVASPFWEEVREGDPFAVAFHQVIVPSLWSCCDLDVPREGNLIVLGEKLRLSCFQMQPKLTRILCHVKKESPETEPIALADPDCAMVAVNDSGS